LPSCSSSARSTRPCGSPGVRGLTCISPIRSPRNTSGSTSATPCSAPVADTVSICGPRCSARDTDGERTAWATVRVIVAYTVFSSSSPFDRAACSLASTPNGSPRSPRNRSSRRLWTRAAQAQRPGRLPWPRPRRPSGSAPRRAGPKAWPGPRNRHRRRGRSAQ